MNSEKIKKALRMAVNVGCGFEGDAEDAAKLLSLITFHESRIAELEAIADKLAAALTYTYNRLPTHWRGVDWCPYSYSDLMVELRKLKEVQ